MAASWSAGTGLPTGSERMGAYIDPGYHGHDQLSQVSPKLLPGWRDEMAAWIEANGWTFHAHVIAAIKAWTELDGGVCHHLV